MSSDDERPKYRAAELVTETHALEAFASNDPERIRLALIDGSRCLEAAWIFPHAWRFVRHGDPSIRWAAVFALDQARAELIRDGLAGEIAQNDDSPALVLTNLATRDPDPSIRTMAGTTLLDMIGDLTQRVRELEKV